MDGKFLFYQTYATDVNSSIADLLFVICTGTIE